MAEYAKRDHMALGDYYMRHVMAMTAEGLHAKSAIAGELAWRDEQIAAERGRNGVLSGLLRRCGATIETIVPESEEDAQLLYALERDIERALTGPATDDLLTERK